MAYSYQQKRVFHDDDTWSDISTIEFPADKLRFQDVVCTEYETRLRDIAHLRYVKALLRGESKPIIVVWACLDDDRTCADLFPSLNAIADDGEHLISANSLITYTMRSLLARHWLFYDANEWQLNIPPEKPIWQKRARTILDWLIENKRIYLETSPDTAVSAQDFLDFPAQFNAIPVGRCGFLGQEVQEKRYQIAFNAAYFLLEHDDFLSHHSALGEAYNLFVSGGDIHRPPLYPRSAIWCDSRSNWHIDRIGMQDMIIGFTENIILSHEADTQDADFSFVINPEKTVPLALYTRYYGVESHGAVSGYTPQSDGRIEFTVIDTRIVGWKSGGNLLIPQNGFILSFAPGQLSTTQRDSILSSSRIQYLQGKCQDMQEAIQCSPRLLLEGQVALHDTIFEDEAFWISRYIDGHYAVGVVPSDYPIDTDTVRAGRVGIGIKTNGNLVVVAVSGVNAGFHLDNTDSRGATLLELAHYLKSAGVVDAVNLDGGGSTQLFLNGGALTRPGDRRGSPGIVYQRMIPSAGVVT